MAGECLVGAPVDLAVVHDVASQFRQAHEMWDIQTNVIFRHLKSRLILKTYMVHPRCTLDIQNVRGTFTLILRHFKVYITLQNVEVSGRTIGDCVIVCQEVRGTFKLKLRH